MLRCSIIFSTLITAAISAHKNRTTINHDLFRKLQDFSVINSNLNSYGCWCYFDSHSEAQGPIMDIYDSFCRDLHHGYSCIMMQEDGCIPWEVDYVSAVGNNVDAIRSNCAKTNAGDQCKIKACIVEMYFYTRALDMLISIDTYAISLIFLYTFQTFYFLVKKDCF